MRIVRSAQVVASESRRLIRCRLPAPVFFFWSDAAGNVQSGEGVARDISAGGMFVWTDSLPTVGAHVALSLLLPRLDATQMRMQVDGFVRHVRWLECTGFGVCSQEVVLTDDPSGSASLLWHRA